MYPNNIYIKNYAEIQKLTGDIGVQLDKYDHAHGLKKDELARAQFKHWRAVETGASSLLSIRDRELLGL